MPWILETIYGQSDSPVDFRLADNRLSQYTFLGMPPNPKLPDEHVVPPKGDWPVPIHQTTSHEQIPDYTMGPYSNQILVSAWFRDLLERLEPDVHHFVPVTITLLDGSSKEGTHFLFYNGQWLQKSIITGKSNVQLRKLPRSGNIMFEVNRSAPLITWDRNKIKGRHLWSDEQLWDVICVSDTLFEQLRPREPRGVMGFESRSDFLA